MAGIPRWVLWAAIGAFVGVIGGYCLFLASDPPQRLSSLERWIGGDDTLLWVGIGAGLGALLSFVLGAAKAPPQS